MTREEFESYYFDQTKEVTPVMFFYYKLKGGHLDEESFIYYFKRWAALLAFKIRFYIDNVYNDLAKHFNLSLS